MGISENTKNSCLRLMRYLNRVSRIEELEQMLLLENNNNNLIIIPKKITSWQKKVEMDFDLIRKELEDLNQNRESLSLDEQKNIVRSLVQEMIDQNNNDRIEKTYLLYCCYELLETVISYDHILSESYDTREIEPYIQPSNRMTGYYDYHTRVEKPYDLPKLVNLSNSIIKQHNNIKKRIPRFTNNREWYTKNLLDEEFNGFAKLKIESANFDFRVKHEISVSNKIINSLRYFIKNYLEDIMYESL